MRWWLLPFLIGCGTKANSKYCESSCADPGQVCDVVAHVCVAVGDMAVGDLAMAVDDLSAGIDLNGVDLNNVDLIPPPACTMSSTCPDNLPVCDATALMCRACV